MMIKLCNYNVSLGVELRGWERRHGTDRSRSEWIQVISNIGNVKLY